MGNITQGETYSANFLTYEISHKKKACKSFILLWVQVAELVTSEFFEQGDRERSELKLTPSVSTPDHLCFCAFRSLFHPDDLHKQADDSEDLFFSLHSSKHTDYVWKHERLCLIVWEKWIVSLTAPLRRSCVKNYSPWNIFKKNSCCTGFKTNTDLSIYSAVRTRGILVCCLGYCVKTLVAFT